MPWLRIWESSPHPKAAGLLLGKVPAGPGGIRPLPSVPWGANSYNSPAPFLACTWATARNEVKKHECQMVSSATTSRWLFHGMVFFITDENKEILRKTYLSTSATTTFLQPVITNLSRKGVFALLFLDFISRYSLLKPEIPPELWQVFKKKRKKKKDHYTNIWLSDPPQLHNNSQKLCFHVWAPEVLSEIKSWLFQNLEAKCDLSLHLQIWSPPVVPLSNDASC